MDSFFNLIFENFFIVIIIVVAIFNFLSKAKKGSAPTDGEASETTREKPKRSIQDIIEEKTEQARESYQKARETMEVEVEKGINDFEEQRQKQYEQLRSQIQSTQPDQDREKADWSKANVPTRPHTEQVESAGVSIDEHLSEKLTKQGLAESIVMAEVLGPPRALNPYQNVAMKRKGK